MVDAQEGGERADSIRRCEDVENVGDLAAPFLRDSRNRNWAIPSPVRRVRFLGLTQGGRCEDGIRVRAKREGPPYVKKKQVLW